MALLTIAEALNKALEQEMKRDPSVMIMGEDVGLDGGVLESPTDSFNNLEQIVLWILHSPSRRSWERRLASRWRGMKPVAEIQFDGFVYPAFDQLISHAARIRNRSRGKLSCPLVVRFPYGGE